MVETPHDVDFTFLFRMTCVGCGKSQHQLCYQTLAVQQHIMHAMSSL